MLKWRFLIVNALLAIALAGSLWSRHIDNAVGQQGNFLPALALPYHGWATSDIALSAADTANLMPDSVLVRNYRSPAGDEVQLAVVAGHRKRSIHTPAFCMAGSGWETISEQSTKLVLGGKTIPATRQVMDDNGSRIVVTYFFTDGDYCSSSLVDFQAVELIKRFRQRVPMGALIRVIAPVQTSQAQAVALSDDFSRATVPAVMESLRRAQIDLR